MDNLVKADIFFFVATVSIVFLTAFAIIILGYLVSILNKVKKVVNTLEKESDLWIRDFGSLRENFRNVTGGIFSVIKFFSMRAPKTSRGSKKKKVSEGSEV